MEHTASDYRMMSSMCLEIANAMSLESDRVRLTARAQEWLELAHQAQAKRLPETTQGQYPGSVYEAVEPPKQSNTTAQENLDIGDNSADEVMLDRAPASQDSRPEIVDDAPGGTPCSLDGRTGADPVDEGSRNIASVSALEASVPKKLVTQPGELDAGVQCAGSAHEAVESRTQSNAIAEQTLDIAGCPAVDEVRPDRALASQDSQTQADPIANESRSPTVPRLTSPPVEFPVRRAGAPKLIRLPRGSEDPRRPRGGNLVPSTALPNSPNLMPEYTVLVMGWSPASPGPCSLGYCWRYSLCS